MRKLHFHPVQIIAAALAAGMLVWFCLPGFFNAGTFLGVLLSLIIIAAALAFPCIARFVKFLAGHIAGRIALFAVGTAAALFLGYLGFCGVQMAGYSDRPLTRVNAVMILGCQVHGETPGKELVDRLETALPLIEQNPAVPVIVTGGQGRGEDMTEADCMKQWLLENGVPAARIYTEIQSDSTRTNFANCAPIFRQLGVTDGIAVVTNDYHQYRADIYARREGLSVGHYSTSTRALVLPNYIIRELAALCFVWR